MNLERDGKKKWKMKYPKKKSWESIVVFHAILLIIACSLIRDTVNKKSRIRKKQNIK